MSQYIGEFHPDAHLNGFSGCKIIALICNNDFAICLAMSILYIMSQKYKVYINNSHKIITDDWDLFCQDYICLEAAGGLVYNKDEKIIMIYRNGVWDLPKGKLEDDESLENCAIREVSEECGVKFLNIQEKITVTYHTYIIDKINYLKKTTWFSMYNSKDEKLIPQVEEGIAKVVWVNQNDLPNKLRNSYENIKDVFSYV